MNNIRDIFQNTRISQDLGAGILISNTALVLQSVKKELTGAFTCTASNIEGDTVSNTQILTVKCEYQEGGRRRGGLKWALLSGGIEVEV